MGAVWAPEFSNLLGIVLGVILAKNKKDLDCSSKSLNLLGAGDGFRTRNPQLGRLMLCQLSYSRFFLLESHLIACDGALDQ